ncbi:Hypothetical predicted protein [Olea europaea subsp. europaea]|uniref:Uncharacterized protein n=1 Tax=Olea europaea subsp. europaea TaxID=158383 RepID=A0A8S0TKE4_OLEEU|nr:Hypothetical predicted protein [Olea europaea subsp. europaea]
MRGQEIKASVFRCSHSCAHEQAARSPESCLETTVSASVLAASGEPIEFFANLTLNFRVPHHGWPAPGRDSSVCADRAAASAGEPRACGQASRAFVCSRGRGGSGLGLSRRPQVRKRRCRSRRSREGAKLARAQVRARVCVPQAAAGMSSTLSVRHDFCGLCSSVFVREGVLKERKQRLTSFPQNRVCVCVRVCASVREPARARIQFQVGLELAHLSIKREGAPRAPPTLTCDRPARRVVWWCFDFEQIFSGRERERDDKLRVRGSRIGAEQVAGSFSMASNQVVAGPTEVAANQLLVGKSKPKVKIRLAERDASRRMMGRISRLGLKLALLVLIASLALFLLSQVKCRSVPRGSDESTERRRGTRATDVCPFIELRPPLRVCNLPLARVIEPIVGVFPVHVRVAGAHLRHSAMFAQRKHGPRRSNRPTFDPDTTTTTMTMMMMGRQWPCSSFAASSSGGFKPAHTPARRVCARRPITRARWACRRPLAHFLVGQRPLLSPSDTPGRRSSRKTKQAKLTNSLDPKLAPRLEPFRAARLTNRTKTIELIDMRRLPTWSRTLSQVEFRGNSLGHFEGLAELRFLHLDQFGANLTSLEGPFCESSQTPAPLVSAIKLPKANQHRPNKRLDPHDGQSQEPARQSAEASGPIYKLFRAPLAMNDRRGWRLISARGHFCRPAGAARDGPFGGPARVLSAARAPCGFPRRGEAGHSAESPRLGHEKERKELNASPIGRNYESN